MSRMFAIRALLFGLFLFWVTPLHSQTATPDSSDEHTTFRSNVRVVLPDIVVRNGKDEPVTGLPKEDFQILEDGQPQALASFEEHAGLPRHAGIGHPSEAAAQRFLQPPAGQDG
jgi:hypothetical protein